MRELHAKLIADSTMRVRRLGVKWDWQRGRQGQGAVLVGDGGARPDNEPTHRAHISDKAPLVWRAPEGPEGLSLIHI